MLCRKGRNKLTPIGNGVKGKLQLLRAGCPGCVPPCQVSLSYQAWVVSGRSLGSNKWKQVLGNQIIYPAHRIKRRSYINTSCIPPPKSVPKSWVNSSKQYLLLANSKTSSTKKPELKPFGGSIAILKTPPVGCVPPQNLRTLTVEFARHGDCSPVRDWKRDALKGWKRHEGCGMNAFWGYSEPSKSSRKFIAFILVSHFNW